MYWRSPHHFLLLFCLCHCDGLELRKLEVPSLTELFLPVRLGCRFRLGTSRLHSVKWYKDDEEFYRFTPTEKPPVRQFYLPGAQVELERSDMHIVKLSNVTRLSAGLYRCEVSSEGPHFDTVQMSSRMDVYALPDRKPEINIQKTNIYSGEYIVANCSSGKSYPQQKLVWYLNGIKVNSSCITDEKTTVTGSGLFRSYSTVRIAAKGGPGPILLSCIGEQGPSLPPFREYIDLSLHGEPKIDRFIEKSSGNHPSPHLEQQSSLYYTLKFFFFIVLYVYAYITVYYECIS